MIKRLRYIFPALILLSLTALGNTIFIPNFCVKYSKETEWVTQAGSAAKISKCFEYAQYSYTADNELQLSVWPLEYVNYFNQKVRVKIISQTKILYHISFKNRLFITLNIPGKSIEDCLNSINQKNWLAKDCLSCPCWHDKNSIKCNSLFNRKWINRQLKTFVYSNGLNDFQDLLRDGATSFWPPQ